jgi:hypothetical protein
VSLGKRSTGELKKNVPCSIQDFSVAETFLAIFMLDNELTRTFLSLIVIEPDFSSL